MTTRRRAPARAGELLGAAGLADDGLLVLANGTYVRALEVGPVNPLVLDEPAAERVSAGFARLVARIPDDQSLQFCAQALPFPLERVAAGERGAVDVAAAAVEAAGDSARGLALRRLGVAQEHSLRTHSTAMAAVVMRYTVICPWRPSRPLRRRRRGTLRVDAIAHERAARESLRYAEGVRSDLETMDLRGRLLDGGEYADLIWARFAPGRLDRDEPPPSRLEPPVAGALTDARDELEAGELARYLGDVLCPEPIEAAHPRYLRVGDSLEQSAYLASIPEHTWVGWLLHLMHSTRPFTLSVHVHATQRHRERTHHRRRYKRIYGVNRGTELRERPLDPEMAQQEQEAAELNAELARIAGSGVYRVGVYLSVREPGPERDAELLSEEVADVCREATSTSDARLVAGRGAQLRTWRSTLPIGVDALRRWRKYVTRNVADTLPLVGSACGSPGGIPLGYAHPGRTLERLDPFDPAHDNHLLVINGKSGSGKTMAANVILGRLLARGARGFIIDRAGHFDFLCSLIPGAQSLRVGARADEHAVNPWDVPDVRRVDGEKVDYLLSLHSLLIGRHDAGNDEYGLEPLESNLLGLAIRGVYDRCAVTGETPRELLLQEELYKRAAEEADGGSVEIAAVLRTLAERLHHYVGDGTYAYLTDRETTVAPGAPLVAFDTRNVPDALAGAVLFIVAEYVRSTIERARERYLAGKTGEGGPWGGRTFLVIDEAWKLVERRATGRWVNELARRSRHLALFLVAISQQLADFKGEHGQALLTQSSMHLLLRQHVDQLAYVRDALRLSNEEIQAISSLTTAKREYSTAFFINGTRGRGTLSIRVSELEYWIATSDPDRDEPLRRAALREAGGDPWRALRLLADPDWHADRAAAGERRRPG